MSRLLILSGLPGAGKTTLAQALARRKKAIHLRIDTIEQALRDLCNMEVEGEGYRLAYRIAADNLRLGLEVVADSCNSIQLTRREWEEVANANGAEFANIEVICSDADEHRRRIESRGSDVAGLRLPTWSDVQNREYHDWLDNRLVVDTANSSVDVCIDLLVVQLDASG